MTGGAGSFGRLLAASCVAGALLLGGCATLPGGEASRSPKDPFEPYNRSMDAFNQALDDALVAPVARGYRAVLPAGMRAWVGNFFANLWDLPSAGHQLLQGKPERAFMGLFRFGVNTTLGFGGILDIATAAGIERHREDFGQTLGRWGIPPGPYLVLPLFGPSSVRDGVGLVLDFRNDLVSYIDSSETRLGLRALWIVDVRERLLDATGLVEGIALDRYLFVRDSYLQRRQSLVWDGEPPEDEDEDEDKEDDARNGK